MSESEAIWTEADQARADLIAEIACEIGEDEDVVAMALDAYDARRNPVEAAAPDLYEANKSSLMVLCAIREMHVWSRNMLADIDFAIEASRAALSKVSQQTDTPQERGQQNEGAES